MYCSWVIVLQHVCFASENMHRACIQGTVEASSFCRHGLVQSDVGHASYSTAAHAPMKPDGSKWGVVHTEGNTSTCKAVPQFQVPKAQSKSPKLYARKVKPHMQ